MGREDINDWSIISACSTLPRFYRVQSVRRSSTSRTRYPLQTAGRPGRTTDTELLSGVSQTTRRERRVGQQVSWSYTVFRAHIHVHAKRQVVQWSAISVSSMGTAATLATTSWPACDADAGIYRRPAQQTTICPNIVLNAQGRIRPTTVVVRYYNSARNYLEPHRS